MLLYFLTAWFVASVFLGLFIGRVCRRRDASLDAPERLVLDWAKEHSARTANATNRLAPTASSF